MRGDLYSTGEFAQKADVSVRTIHFYEKKGLIHPRFISDSGYRYYGEKDFALLQKIVFLKSLGFSLDEIQAFSLKESDAQFMQDSFDLQLKLVGQKIEQLQTVQEALSQTAECYRKTHQVNWKDMILLIKMMNMEHEIVEQYKNGQNIKSRIDLHESFSHQKENWFVWIFRHLNWSSHSNILEVGCGTGDFWLKNAHQLGEKKKITITDISPGIVQDAREKMKELNQNFIFGLADASQLPYENHQFDLILANHMMFYVQQPLQALEEFKRVLTLEGTVCIATYGQQHMQEIEQLVKGFNEKISLSSVHLYDNFGLENGYSLCKQCFDYVERIDDDDYLEVTEPLPLLDYILSCHGNQKEFILPNYEQFLAYLQEQIDKQGAFHVTKQAGIIICQNERMIK